MKYTFLVTLILSCHSLLAAQYWGKPFSPTSPTPLFAAIKDFSSTKGKTLVFKAKVGNVCSKKGCWMILTDQDTRVTFSEYKFFVPVTLVGKDVLVKGQLNRSVVDVKTAKHFAKDRGLDPSTIKGPKREYQIVASGVSLPVSVQ